jgi:Flp pilus assembly pilin Flp
LERLRECLNQGDAGSTASGAKASASGVPHDRPRSINRKLTVRIGDTALIKDQFYGNAPDIAQALIPVELRSGLMLDVIRSLIITEDGVTVIEYAFVASLISIAVAAGVGTVGTSVSAMFASVAASF